MSDNLPKIIAVLAKEDHGPCDAGATAVCPHCGADGRYIYTFLCDDGTTRGAMAGCIKLFPRSSAAIECERALSKQCETKKGGFLSTWDKTMLQAIEDLQANRINTQTLEGIAKNIHFQKKAWIRSKYGR